MMLAVMMVMMVMKEVPRKVTHSMLISFVVGRNQTKGIGCELHATAVLSNSHVICDAVVCDPIL